MAFRSPFTKKRGWNAGRNKQSTSEFFTQYVKVFIDAHKLGDKFGKEVMKNA